jgi:DEAD/DEAH box helicase domain-containing protein
MQSVVRKLLEHPTLGKMVAHHRQVNGRPAEHAETARPLPDELREALAAQGIERLYTHQARGIDLAREGHDVVAVTPTASGKTLLFASCALESVLDDPRSRALFLYPTKALARDQLSGLRQLAGGLGALQPPSFEIYDGDTPAARRRKIKTDPPSGLITNPDMLHLGILAHHEDWESFFRDLRWVVLDEMHVYRGIFGAHVHHILARLRRVAAKYGAAPRFVAASATVGNPKQFAGTLVGRPFEVVTESGAARAPLDVVFLNPVGVSPYTVTVRMLAELVGHGLRSIAFTKARRITELIYTWLVRQQPELRSRVAPYRAGYRPEERRALERRLFDGDLSAVIATSALELGIDVGGLDACILVGYPGSLISSWQRIGRVGRRGRGLVVFVAMPDALDQYVVRHPDMFFGRQFEKAILDPWNPLVAGQHLVCAAAEEPLQRAELEALGSKSLDVVTNLADEGRLVQDARGRTWFSFRRNPHRDVSPRSAGRPYLIVTRAGEREKVLGKIDGTRVWHECHVGAIYLHGGQSFLVRNLDEERRRVVVEAAQVDYYTVVLGEKETAILEQLERRSLGQFFVGYGKLKVTVRIHGYQKRRLFGGEPLSSHPLDVPPMVYETVGFWIEMPAGLPAAFASRDLHFMGGIHAAEHAIIGLFPLLAIADRGDVGGISYTGHPQLGAPAVFIYDGMPGGAGLADQGFRDLESLLDRTLELVCGCSCEDGCPGCIQSPNCGNGNKPLDKEAARLVLRAWVGKESLESLGVEPAEDRDPRPLATLERTPSPAPDLDSRGKHGIIRAGNVEPGDPAPLPPALEPAPSPAPAPTEENVVVFDLETQRSAEEVGGWAESHRMGLALAVVHDLRRDVWRTYYESDVHRLLLDLVMADCVVGFNIDKFDLAVLSGYSDWDLKRIRTLDLLGEIRKQLGFSISLNKLGELNLGQGKAGDGLQSLRWWKEGRIDLIERYCRQDVDMTRRLYELGRSQGYLLYRDHSDRSVRVPVRW